MPLSLFNVPPLSLPLSSKSSSNLIFVPNQLRCGVLTQMFQGTMRDSKLLGLLGVIIKSTINNLWVGNIFLNGISVMEADEF